MNREIYSKDTLFYNIHISNKYVKSNNMSPSRAMYHCCPILLVLCALLTFNTSAHNTVPVMLEEPTWSVSQNIKPSIT